MKKFLPLLLIIMLAFTGCGDNNSLKKKQMQTYINQKAGYVILLPNDWQKKYENDISSGFVGQNPNVAMDIVFEIGGFDYFSLDSLGEELIKNYKKKIKDVKIIEKDVSKVNDDAYRVILQGKTPEGKEIIIKTIFFEPAVGIRYYMAFAANPKDYYANDYLFEEIAQTFEMTKGDQDLYKLLADREEEEFKKRHMEEQKKQKAQDKAKKSQDKAPETEKNKQNQGN